MSPRSGSLTGLNSLTLGLRAAGFVPPAPLELQPLCPSEDLMEIFLVAGMVLALLALAVLIFVGGRPLRPGAGMEAGQITGPWPRVAVLLPVTGSAAGLSARLEPLLCQDYPDYQVVFATRDAADPAAAVICDLLPNFPGARHVVAGPARCCGQKNQNLLATVRLVARTPEILVFRDSNQEAHPGWLRELVAPSCRPVRSHQRLSAYHCCGAGGRCPGSSHFGSRPLFDQRLSPPQPALGRRHRHPPQPV